MNCVAIRVTASTLPYRGPLLNLVVPTENVHSSLDNFGRGLRRHASENAATLGGVNQATSLAPLSPFARAQRAREVLQMASPSVEAQAWTLSADPAI